MQLLKNWWSQFFNIPGTSKVIFEIIDEELDYADLDHRPFIPWLADPAEGISKEIILKSSNRLNGQ